MPLQAVLSLLEELGAEPLQQEERFYDFSYPVPSSIEQLNAWNEWRKNESAYKAPIPEDYWPKRGSGWHRRPYIYITVVQSPRSRTIDISDFVEYDFEYSCAPSRVQQKEIKKLQGRIKEALMSQSLSKRRKNPLSTF